MNEVQDEWGPELDERVVGAGKSRDTVAEPHISDVPDQKRIHPVLASIRALDRGGDQISGVRPHLFGHSARADERDRPGRQDRTPTRRHQAPQVPSTEFFTVIGMSVRQLRPGYASFSRSNLARDQRS
ncbi:hypothetical protein LCL61_28650 [Amycolatopsis coloradensis]|uniref:Uncharacterized protein n=1 Tax=Amycolatopsis coloradensis TaxID=76021 RepID=A0ACD5BJG5_9PSEU